MKTTARGIGVLALGLAAGTLAVASPATVSIGKDPTKITVGGPPPAADASKITVTTDSSDPDPNRTVPQVTMQFPNPGGSSDPLQFDVNFGTPAPGTSPATSSYMLEWRVTNADIKQGLEDKFKEIGDADDIVIKKILELQDISPRTPAEEAELQALLAKHAQFLKDLAAINNMIKQVKAGNYSNLTVPKVSILFQKPPPKGPLVVLPKKKEWTTVAVHSNPLSPAIPVK